MFPKQVVQVSLPPAVDQVIAAFPIPAGSIVNGFWLEHSLVNATVDFPILSSPWYGVSAYVVPVDDPDDNAVVPETIWDEKVPKDTAVGSGVLDMDTATADTTTEFELGMLDVSDFVDITTAPIKLFERRKMITFASHPIGYHLDPVTPFTDQFWVPTDYYSTEVHGKRARVNYPSYLIVGLSQPGYGSTTTAFPTLRTKPEWLQIQYLEETLMEMWKSVTGLVATGTQESAFEAALLMEEFFEHFQEEDAAAWGHANSIWRSWSKFTLDLTLEGTFKKVQLGSAL